MRSLCVIMKSSPHWLQLEKAQLIVKTQCSQRKKDTNLKKKEKHSTWRQILIHSTHREGLICFFYFKPCFPLLLFTTRIPSIHNGLPWGALPLCLNVKPECPCSGPCPQADGYRKEKINISPPPPRLAIPGEVCKINDLFTLLPHLPLLCSIKEPGIRP